MQMANAKRDNRNLLARFLAHGTPPLFLELDVEVGQVGCVEEVLQQSVELCAEFQHGEVAQIVFHKSDEMSRCFAFADAIQQIVGGDVEYGVLFAVQQQGRNGQAVEFGSEVHAVERLHTFHDCAFVSLLDFGLQFIVIRRITLNIPTEGVDGLAREYLQERIGRFCDGGRW